MTTIVLVPLAGLARRYLYAQPSAPPEPLTADFATSVAAVPPTVTEETVGVPVDVEKPMIMSVAPDAITCDHVSPVTDAPTWPAPPAGPTAS